MAGQQLADRLQDPPVKVKAAIRELRKAYQDGRSILRKLGERTELGKHQIEQVAKELGRTADSCRKLRQFAGYYSQAALRELCDLCRRHRRAFGLSFVYKLVSIKSRADRRGFQKDAIAGHWGHTRITRELRIRFGRRDEERGRNQRGRKPYVPEGTAEALEQIAEMTFRLVRWQEHFAELAEQGQTGRLPGPIASKLNAAIKASKALYRSASRASRQSRKPMA
jgi:hypothetical protein